ncbi:CoA-transferase family III [Aureobasidium sp. EXF-12298]|nr:CoA-transferase family III [Aureobasidium sp. EXF-12298]
MESKRHVDQDSKALSADAASSKPALRSDPQSPPATPRFLMERRSEYGSVFGCFTEAAACLVFPSRYDASMEHEHGTNHGSTGVKAEGLVTVDRSSFDAADVVEELWTGLGLPSEALSRLRLDGNSEPALPSSFRIGVLAQSSIALSALAAAQLHALRNEVEVPQVEVPLQHVVIEFKSERFYTIDNQPQSVPPNPIGGLHQAADGYIRVHDSFPNHSNGMLELVGLPLGSTREQLANEIVKNRSVELEDTATVKGNLAAYALRSYSEWDALPQSKAIADFPISLQPISSRGSKGFSERFSRRSTKCLEGLRVLEMSRVIAAPLCGKTLAAHGADVIWVTSPNLPDLPSIDREFSRGKRTIQLDIQDPTQKAKLLELIRDCDVFIQGFRPGSLAKHGLSLEELVKINPSIIIANMSAFGPAGPWSGQRGFDSLVQTCSGMNVSEAEHAEQGEPARAMPCQALDHASGYLLATGVTAALYRRAVQGGAWQVDVSLAATMKYLRSLGQYPGTSGFQCKDYKQQADLPAKFLETRETGFGTMTAVKHSAKISSCDVGWDIMPKPLGSDSAEWL